MSINKKRGERGILAKSISPSHQDQQQHDYAIISEKDQRFTTQIIRILVEKHNPEEVKNLMEAELDIQGKRLKLIRDHAEHHPDAKEERANKLFRTCLK